MVKIDDELILKASGGLAGALGVGLLAAPEIFNKHMLTDSTRVSANNPFFQHTGLLCGTMGALSLAAVNADKDTRKKMLKIQGAAWVARGAVHAINTHRGKQNKDMSVAAAAGEIAMGALSLWAGFHKDEA